MSQPIELPNAIFDALAQPALAAGTTPAGWIAAHLPTPPPTAPANGAKSLADLFAGRIGRIDGGGASLSQNCCEQFADDRDRKRRVGRL